MNIRVAMCSGSRVTVGDLAEYLFLLCSDDLSSLHYEENEILI